MDFQFDCEQTSPLVKTYTVHVPSDGVREEMVDRLKQIQRRHRQRGFRPGKVPMSIIRQRFGAGVRAEVIQALVQRSISDILGKVEDMVHYTNPELLSRDIESQGIKYAFNVETLPEVEPKDYMGLEASRPRVEVTDAMVDEVIAKLRDENTFNEPIERTVVEAGDTLSFDYRIVSVDGEAQETPQAEQGIEATLGEGKVLAAFEEGLVGATVGEAKVVSVEFGQEAGALAGKSAEVELTVRAIYRLVVPELDDDLAKDDGRVETLEELRQLVRDELAEEGAKAAKDAAEASVLDKLVEVNPLELPPGYVTARAREEFKRRFGPMLGGMQNFDSSELAERLIADMRPDVELTLKRSLLLGAIAEAEGVEPTTDEIEARLAEILDNQSNPRQRDAARRHYRTAQGQDELKFTVRLNKTIELLVANATFVEVDPLPAHDHSHEHDHAHCDDPSHNHDHSHDHAHQEHDEAEEAASEADAQGEG